jgi:hypothetical protein
MIQARGLHTATPLPDGGVLVTGGGAMDLSGCTASTERFMPAGRRWVPEPPMSVPRCHHVAAPLPGGAVVVAGGGAAGDAGAQAEVFRS